MYMMLTFNSSVCHIPWSNQESDRSVFRQILTVDLSRLWNSWNIITQSECSHFLSFFFSPFPPPDNVTYRSGPVRLAGLHQPPGAEDLSVQPAARPLRLPSPHPGRLGDPQRPERQAFLLQPRHWRAHLEAAAHQGHKRQH